MGGKTTTISQSAQRIGTIRIQTSQQAQCIPVVLGRARVAANLLWYGSFRSIEHTETQRQGGKGGGGGKVKTVTKWYSYEAAVIIGLCQGPINGIVSAWRGKERLWGDVVPAVTRNTTTRVTLPPNRQVTVPGYVANIGVMPVLYGSEAWYGSSYRNLVPGQDYTVTPGGQYTFNGFYPQTGREAIIGYVQQISNAYTRNALGQLGLSLASGRPDQPVWSWLQDNHPAQALAYPGIAYVHAPAYSLTDAAELPNHNFEVSTGWELGYVPGVPAEVLDADPATIVPECLCNTRWGASWPQGSIAGLQRYSDYCIANGIWLSPVLQEQTSAADWLTAILRITNTDVVWSEGTLKFVPLGDQSITANGRTFTADTTPVYDLTDAHFIADEGEPPVRIRRHQGQDGSTELATGDDVGYNIITLEIENRANGYNVEPVSAQDTAHIDLYGRRPKDTIKAYAIKDVAVGAAVAQIMLQAELGKRNVYEFRLPWSFGLLEPLDLLTLTEPTTFLDRVPVRILTIEEDGEHYTVTAEDAPIGIASAPRYGAQAGTGYQPDYNAPPGNVAIPVIFEPPVELAGSSGLAVWVAVTGTTPEWGGADVWVSLDGGDNYKLMGRATGARYGTLAAPLAAGDGASLQLQLAGRGGELLTASAGDAQALATLLMVRDTPSSTPEYMAHTTATLTGAGAYTLTTSQRGAYLSPAAAHTAGAAVVRVDDAILRSEPLQRDMIGRQLLFKFCSVNVFGSGQQLLEDVEPVAYTISGAMALLPPTNVSSFLVSVQTDGTRQFDWAWSSAAPRTADTTGVRIRYRQGHDDWTWDDMAPFDTTGNTTDNQGYYTASPLETNQLLAGDYTFAIKAVDSFGVESAEPLYQLVTFPDPRLGDALVYRALHQEGWPGTLTDAVRDTDAGAPILRAADTATWAALPATWAQWTRWVWAPALSWTYQPPDEDFGTTVSVTPSLQWVGEGDVLAQEQHSTDGSTWTPWAPLAGAITAQHVRLRITVSVPAGAPTGPGITPVTLLSRLTIAYRGKVTTELGNDVDPLTLGPYRIAAGHYKLPLLKPFVRHSRWGITLQNVGPGWDVDIVDPSVATGFVIKTYNGAGVLADPPLIDYWVEGIVP